MKRYRLDPSKISLERFLELTRNKRVVPGRAMLQDQIEERFQCIAEAGVTHLGALLLQLGSKTRIQLFSTRSGLPFPYLVLLKREAASYLAKPIPLGNFPGIPLEYLEVLKSKGIRNSLDFFEASQTDQERRELGLRTGIPTSRITEIHSLCDLTRITGIGGVAARMLYHAGIRSVDQFAAGEAAGLMGENDLHYCMDYARIVVEFDRLQADI
jgi:hypothetical protein